jgi:chaperonin GroES
MRDLKVVPLGDRLLVKPFAEQVTDSGLYITQSLSERSYVMKVVAVGSEVCDFSVGDRVLVSKYAGIEVAGMREKHYILRSGDILAQVMM